MRVCPSCGHENADDVDFCQSCGQYVRWEPTRLAPAVKPGEPAAVAAPEAPPAAPPVAADGAGVVPPPPQPGAPEQYAPPPGDVPPAAPPPEAPPAAPPVEPDSVLMALHLPGVESEPGAPITVGVEAGAQVSIMLLIRNQSGIVDNYDLAVAGIPEHWWTVTPRTVYLVPYGTSEEGFEQEVEIRLHPPRAPEAEARPWPVQVTAGSRAHGVQVGAADATLEVAPYAEIESEMRPERKAGRTRARFAVAVRNKANAPNTVELAAVDAGNQVRFEIEHPQFPTRPGRRAGTIFWAKPLKQIWIGRKVEHRFTLDAKTIGYDATAIPKMGVYVQKPWLPLWLLILLPLLIALLIAAYLLWPRTVTVPNVRICGNVACAQRLLESKDLKLGTQTPVKTNRRPPGSPVGSSPGTGKDVKKGTVVDIRVAEALGPPRIEVPNVVGMTLADADAALEKAKLQRGTLTPQPDSPDAKVTGQVPEAGKRAAEGRAVDLFFEEAAPTTAGTGTETGGGATTAPGGDTGGTPPPPTPPAAGAPLTPEQLTDQYVIVFDNGKDILTMPSGTGKPVKPLINSDDAESEATVYEAGDGAVRIAYRRGNADKGQIFVMDPKQPQFAHAITNEGFDDGRPAFSPDGKVIAFIRGLEVDAATGLQDTDLCFVPATAQSAVKPKCITDPSTIVARPTWSPAGNVILALSRPTKDAKQVEVELFTSAKANSGNPASWNSQGLVTDKLHGDRVGDAVFSVAWAPDGEKVALSANWGSLAPYLVVLKAEDAALSAPKSFKRIRSCELSWRPDSNGLAIVQRDNTCRQPGGIARFDLAKPTEVFPLTNPKIGAESPVWSELLAAK